MKRARWLSVVMGAALGAGCAGEGSVDEPHPSGDPSQGAEAALVSVNTCGQAVLVAVNTSDANLYRWTAANPAAGGFSSGAKVGVGWAGIRVIASDGGTGSLFAIDRSGNLRLYSFTGSVYTGGSTIATGWSDVVQLVAAGDGVLYAIRSDGRLQWHRWDGQGWVAGSGGNIGTGWSGLTLFSGGNGIVYAIVKSTGELRWYRHLSPSDGAPGWAGPKTVGNGWSGMRMVVGLGSGLIYAVDGQGRLLLSQHLGYQDGASLWSNQGRSQQIGSNWGSYDRLTANPSACPTEPLAATTASDPRVPQNLKAYGKGGRDLALLWDAVTVAPVARYRIYRDGNLLGSATPRPTGTFFQKSVTYVDSTVVNGATYRYSVQTDFQDGSSSAQSAPVFASYSNAGVPVPNVEVDSSAAPDIAPFLNLGRSILETWYPKVGNMLAQPQYLPPSTIALKAFEPDALHACAGAGWVAWPSAQINICAPWARSNPNDVSIFVHESTHVVQTYTTSVPGGITEGMASWAADLALDFTQPKPAPGALYTDGYAPVSYFFSWILGKRYASGTFVHDLNVPAHQGSFTYDLFKTLTGKTIGQLWTEMSAVATSTEGPLVGLGGKCLDLTLGNTADHTPLELLGCWDTGFQKVIYHATAVGAAQGTLSLMSKCVTTEGRSVTLSTCTGSSSQQWRPSTNWSQVTLTNVATGGCLGPDPADSRANPRLITSACTGTTAQVWTLRP